ncbi:MAG: hypothetical protein Q8N33_08795 [Rhodocyclaceae bacterium]|nr:hypothetical protein [Rhodocyclaceae bacterium]
MAQPEQKAREEIDRLLNAAGWQVFDVAQANIHAARGVALRELPPLPEQHRIVAEVDRLLSIACAAEVDANLKRAQTLRQAILARVFQPSAVSPAPTFA